MCVALGTEAIIGGALSIGGSGANYFQQSAHARSVNSTNREVAERNQRIAKETALNQYKQLAQREVQERTRAFQQISDIMRDSKLAMAKTSVGAAASGVKGQAVRDLINDFQRQEMETIDYAKMNLGYASQQLQAERVNARLGLESRLLSSVPDITRAPNPFASALNGIGDAFRTAISINSAFGKTPDPTPDSSGDYEYHT